MKKLLLLFTLVFALSSNAQLFNYSEGTFYSKPVDLTIKKENVNIYSLDSIVESNICIYREAIWVKEPHDGFYYEPNFNTGDMIPKRTMGNNEYYWRFEWGPWMRCD